jgi:chromate reductase, NAD(P)H dehydrogenase (quinone)
MTQLNVITICGSLRKASFNAALARQLPKLAPAGMAITAGPSIEAIPPYNQDVLDVGVPPAVADFVAAIRAADGLAIVSPEYNWSIPGVLKNAIDWVSHVKDQPFEAKAVSIQSAAPGLLGGSRMQYHLRQALLGIGALMFVRPEIFVNMAAQKFDKQTLELTDQPTIDLIRQHLAGYEKFVRKVTGKA